MNKPLIVLADADVIIAQAHIRDVNHELTLQLGQKLLKTGAHILFPATANAEAITSLQRKYSDLQLAASTLIFFTDPAVAIEEVGQEVIQQANKFVDPNGNKKKTLFDCIVAALTKKYQTNSIFSFDDWYRKLGFQLVADL